MGGDPSLSATGPLLLALQAGGADLIEVGIPFSDPLADGPVIQAASARALSRGATPMRVLEMVASVRARLRVPVVCLSYWNPLVQFAHPPRADRVGRQGLPASRDGGDAIRGSLRAFVRAACGSGLSGVIVPDLPVEEHPALRDAVGRDAFDTVLLAAPTSPPARLRAIARASRGFIYYVSVTGTTGARRALPPGLTHGVRQLRLLTTKPICVGFGISTPAQAAAVARLADGVIVGSALVHAIAQESGRSAVLRRATAYVRRFREAMG
jgi:tryptophan synthase alpha chain